MTPHRIPLALLALVLAGPLTAQEAALGPPSPDELAFSLDNLDPETDPAQDFQRHAAGAWLDRVSRPERLSSYGIFDIMNERVTAQMRRTLTDAGAQAAEAPQGSPARLVGTVYNAYMDVAARDAAGMAPIRLHLEAIAGIDSMQDLPRVLAAMTEQGGAVPLLGLAPSQDLADNRAYSIWMGPGPLSLPETFEDVLEEPDDGPRLTALRTWLVQALRIAGKDAAEADRIAALTIALDRDLHAVRLTPVQRADARNIYNPMTLAEAQALIPQIDLGLFLSDMQLASPDRIIVTDPDYMRTLSGLLEELPLSDLRDYLALQVVLAFQDQLTTAFEEPYRAFNEALLGVPVLPPREERALQMIAQTMGHPLSQLYVHDHFEESTRDKATEMIGLVKAAFEARMPTRAWLSEPTRATAVEKLSRVTYRVGYPDDWIDYSAVQVGADPVANLAMLAAFSNARMRARLGGPVQLDPFSDIHTLPVTVNAAYDPSQNGFEIPAAILQPPMFDPDMDAAVNFCRLGAVIGHEMTHGFDTSGRRFDPQGNLRDWWTPADSTAFEAEADKLVEQADAWQVLPDLKGNGALEVTENMADVGGITLAHAALHDYLANHPDEDRVIDGMTPDQRCFVSWAQMWAWKGTDQFLRMIVARDPHPPHPYRADQPLRHLQAFHDAFGIGPGDPMWLDFAQRVNAW